MRKIVLLCAAVVAVAFAAPAWAHVTVQPTEAKAGSFSRFVVRVPNERDDAATVKVEVQFPANVTHTSFQPKAGWTRTVTKKTLDEPIVVFGEPVTEVIDTVTWEGGRIEPGEFDELGFSIRTADEPGELVFPAVQTYDSGEEVRWAGEADSDKPAGRVTLSPSDGDGHGSGGDSADEDEAAEHDAEGAEGGDDADGGDNDTLPLALGGLGTLLGAGALATASRKRS